MTKNTQESLPPEAPTKKDLETLWNETPPAPPEKKIELTDEQRLAVATIGSWFLDEKGPQIKTLGGYAGTGKTECIKHILKELDGLGHIEVCAFTGKAVSVLKNKGVYRARTLHSLMYQPEYEGDRLVGFKLIDAIDADLVIVDEASMVNASLDADLRKFNKKILYVGDMGQLEPIGDDPNLMYCPDIKITQIHRQAASSPIIAFSKVLREQLPYGYGSIPGLDIVPQGDFLKHIYDCDQVICGFNNTRHMINRMCREKLGFTDPLCVGDRLICLKNNFKLGVFNGLMAKVLSLSESKYSRRLYVCNLEDELGNVLEDVRIFKEQLGQNRLDDFPKIERCTFWDYGYCITAHKAQGSEWKKVVVKHEVIGKWDAKRWAYTSATRASDHLVYCI